VVTEDSEKIKRIQETLATYTNRAEKVLQLRNKKNRDIALLERKIDEVPSRGELMQYQRQFVDLYEQVSLHTSTIVHSRHTKRLWA
jgi:flagellar biosynthesis chaperone FliJ